MNKVTTGFKQYFSGVSLCFCIACLSWFLGKKLPLIGAPIFSIILGMIISHFWFPQKSFQAGIRFCSKKVLQYAVILLGFGLNLSVVLQTGLQSFPIILSTITVALIVAFMLGKKLKMPWKLSTLIGVGSAICGGSAIAATSPVIEADDDEIAQALSVIFLFNLIAAIVFPYLGNWLLFSHTDGTGFGIFAGTAVNDTSSVTATASTWDALYGLGTSTLDKAVTVKLTRTLAIIPITMGLAFYHSKNEGSNKKLSLLNLFPKFILLFLLASTITTVFSFLGWSIQIFTPFKTWSKFLIVLAMAGIGLNTHLKKLIKSGGKAILLGFLCWVSITVVSLVLQRWMGLF